MVNGTRDRAMALRTVEIVVPGMPSADSAPSSTDWPSRWFCSLQISARACSPIAPAPHSGTRWSIAHVRRRDGHRWNRVQPAICVTLPITGGKVTQMAKATCRAPGSHFGDSQESGFVLDSFHAATRSLPPRCVRSNPQSGSLGCRPCHCEALKQATLHFHGA